MRRYKLAVLLLSLSLVSHAALRPYEASYDITVFGFEIVESHHSLTINNKQYQFEINTRSTAPFVTYDFHTKSQGSFYSKPKPRIFAYALNKFGNKRVWQAKLDWRKGKAFTHSNLGDLNYRLPSSSQDKLSHQLMLRMDLKHGKRKRLKYPIIERRYVTTYDFKVKGQEQLDTVLGKLDTIILEQHDKKKSMRLWMAKDYEYLMVKAEHFDNKEKQATAILASYRRY